MKYRIDEAATAQPQVQRVNEKKIRVYFDHHTEERENTDGTKTVVHVAKFIEVPFTGETDALKLIKQVLIDEITEYDSSTAVNEFFLNGNSMWIPRELRNEVEDRLKREMERGHAVLPLDYNGIEISLPATEESRLMLEQLKYYADDCYTVTARHKSTVSTLATVEQVSVYDYTTDYPSKLHFEIAISK